MVIKALKRLEDEGHIKRKNGFIAVIHLPVVNHPQVLLD